MQVEKSSILDWVHGDGSSSTIGLRFMTVLIFLIVSLGALTSPLTTAFGAAVIMFTAFATLGAVNVGFDVITTSEWYAEFVKTK